MEPKRCWHRQPGAGQRSILKIAGIENIEAGTSAWPMQCGAHQPAIAFSNAARPGNKHMFFHQIISPVDEAIDGTAIEVDTPDTIKPVGRGRSFFHVEQAGVAHSGDARINAGKFAVTGNVMWVKNRMTMRELSAPPTDEWRSVLRIFGIGLAAGLFLGFLGPFGTYESLYTGWRLVYWVSLMLGGTLFFPVAYLLARRACARRGLSAWLYVPLVASAGAVPMLIVVIGVSVVMFGDVVHFEVSNYLRVLGISLPMVAVHHLAMEWQADRAAMPEPMRASPRTADTEPPVKITAEAPPAPPRLLQRLPGRLGPDIICLQMEDHYVRVHTALGQALVLMRMRDAIAELDDLVGLQVHRSWWVARQALVGSAREGKSVTLTLANQLVVPVARDRMPELKAAGWLS